MTRLRPLMVFLAVALSLTAVLALPKPATAASVCYWYSYSNSRYVWVDPYTKVTVTVNWQVGYTCDRMPVTTKVTYSNWKVKITSAPSWLEQRIAYHHIQRNDSYGADDSFPYKSCYGVCTVSHTFPRVVTMPYSLDNSTVMGCGPCGRGGSIWNFKYKFIRNELTGSGPPYDD